MYPGNFYGPNMARMMMPNIGRGFVNSSINGMTIPRNMGLFGRIANSIRRFNFSGFLNGANKTLNVVNQSIPLIKQAKPMMNNVKSMVKLARAFGNETVSKNDDNGSKIDNSIKNDNTILNTSNDNYPNFFI